jgi:hypothetical protein
MNAGRLAGVLISMMMEGVIGNCSVAEALVG